MDITSLKRDADHFKNFLFVTKDDRLVTKEAFSICFPALYENHNFAVISDEVMVLGILAFIQGEKYCVNKVMANLPLTPTDIRREKIGEEEYLFLQFEPGSTVCRNINVMQEQPLAYYVYDYFIANGWIPWYLNYKDVVTLFDTCAKHCDIKLGETSSVMEMICATIARSQKEPRKMFRTGKKSVEDLEKEQPFYVPLANVQFGAADTTSKLLGSYFNDGLNSAIMYKTKRVGPIEEVLRA